MDGERLVLVPVLSLLVFLGVAELQAFWVGAGDPGVPHALGITHRVLRLLFYGLMIGLLLTRRGATGSKPTRRATVAAYVGTFCPFLLVLDPGSPVGGEALVLVGIAVTTIGLGLSVYALGWLGRSFGVVPRARRLVRSGPYRYVRHPLYVAEFVCMAGGRAPATPVAVVSEGTMPGERTVLATLETLADRLASEAVRPPAIIVVGDVVAVAHPAHFA